MTVESFSYSINDSPIVDPIVDKRQGISWYSATLLAVNCSLGIGILELPWAYNAAGGILPASIVHYTILALMTGGLAILAYLTHVTRTESYQETMLNTIGPLGQTICIVLMVIEGVGVCVMCLVVMGDHLENFFSSVISEDFVNHWYGNQKLLVSLSSIIFILPLCLLREINFMKYSSAVGVVSIVYVVGLVCVRYVVSDQSLKGGAPSTDAKTWVDTFMIAPGVSVGYMCHFEMVTIFAAMKDDTIKGYAKTTISTVLICAVSNSLVPICGYLMFGSSVNKEIILSYLPTVDVYVAYFVLVIKSYMAFPVIFFCIRNAFYDMWLGAWRLTPDEVAVGERKRRTTIGLGGFASIVFLYVVIPDIVTAIAYTGGLGMSFSCIFPGLSVIHLVLNRKSYFSTFAQTSLVSLGMFYVASGTFLFGVITVQGIIT